MTKQPWTFGISLLLATLVVAGCARQGGEPKAQEAPHGAGEHHDEHAEHGGEQAGHADEHGHGDEHGHEAGVVHMDAEAQKRAGLKVEKSTVHAVPGLLQTTGTFEANGDREAHVTPRIAGRVVKVYKTVGAQVRSGEPLVMIESLELGQAQSDFLQAQARHDLAKATRERQRKLFGSDLTAKKDVQAAESEARVLEIDLERSRNQLKLLGFGPDRQATLATHRKLDPTVPVLSPIGGRVVARHVTLGEMIRPDAEEPAYTVSDMSTLWLHAHLYERDLARVQEGQSATLTTPAYPGRSFKGRVTLISTALERDTRTAQARITVANPDGRLKPQMFANVRIDVGTRQVLAIPQSALVQDKQETFVFVQEGADEFEKRAIKVGPLAGGVYPVESGLTAGEAIVVEGGFTLKSELMKESFGEHHH
jgi:cobalt-zinc-cadmium efflux system membrane fusion protein